jgi:septal ring factor EnvC (AmiA/AmiB activator)
MIVAPSESANNVSGIVENNAMVYPLLYQLLCEGRFLYIVNKETTTEILKQVREETVIFKDLFQEQSQQVEQLRGDLDEFKDGTLNRLDETNTRLDETNTLLDETNTRLNEFKEDTLNRLDQMQAMLELILKKLHGTSDL